MTLIPDWIEDILETTSKNINGRKAVLWGCHETSRNIKKWLYEIYHIETAFFIDSDLSKVDDVNVKKIDSIKNHNQDYYVIVPIAYYASTSQFLKHFSGGWSYK